MYVEDVTDVQELLELRAEAEDRLLSAGDGSWSGEQALWDLEDIDNRLYELGGK